MFKIKIDSSVAPKYRVKFNKLELLYPCESHNTCFPYEITLKKGFYLFECYGASGGSFRGTSTTQRETTGTGCISQDIVKRYKGNTECTPLNSPGSGGYISAKLYIDKETLFYANIGGSGVYGNYPNTKGGYNGGGDCKYINCGSGGGATDIRVIENEFTHRIIVAGGGGGTDDSTISSKTETDNDGSGGSGGYPEGQSYWVQGIYRNVVTNQTSGYSFGIGESAKDDTLSYCDIAGAGGGWFGGYASLSTSGGGSGGSSFALLINSTIPSDVNYSFDVTSKYVMYLNSFANGIWSGDGKIIITKLDSLSFTCQSKKTISRTSLLIFVIILG